MAEVGLRQRSPRRSILIFRTEIEKMKPMRALITEMERGVDAASRANTQDIEAYTRQVRQVEHHARNLIPRAPSCSTACAGC